MNTFDEQKERTEQRGDEWMFGSISKDLANVPLQGRNVYLPAGVLQYNNIFDTKGCASRAPLNILEAKLDYFYENGMHPAIKKWCDDNGYRVDGKFALCDAYIEILSGTTKNGNSMKAPVDAIQNYGVIPAALLPLKDNMTWDEYMNPSRITKAHKDLGAEFLRRLTINYEKVLRDRFAEATSLDLIDVAVGAWSTPVSGIYPKTDIPINHAVARITNEIDIFDSYSPYLKRLVPDYNFFEWGYSLSITNQNPYPNETLALFEVLQKYGLLRFFAEAFHRLVSNTGIAPISPVAETPAVISTPAVETPVAPIPAPTAKQSLMWDTKSNILHSIRVIADEEGLSLLQKNMLCDICNCESGYIVKATLVNSPKSIDRGLFQWNNYYHPDITDEMAYNPEIATRLACKAILRKETKSLWKASSSCWNKSHIYDSLL
jgi:hypothetical protein